MNKRLFIIIFSVLLMFSIPVIAQTDMWVTKDNVPLRACPAEKCGRIGTSYLREKATVHEKKNGWARITKYYDAYCINGLSKYVSEGNAACVEDNGIKDNIVAKWIPTDSLAETRPEDPAKDASGDYVLIKGSDDYGKYKDAFAKAARKLIDEGKCTDGDFQEMGGWLKSTTYLSSPIYFTYCGGMTQSNKLHLNAATGEIFK